MKRWKKIVLALGVLLLTAIGGCVVLVGPWPASKACYENESYFTDALAAIDANAQESDITAEPGSLQAGWAKASITPPIGTPLAGFSARNGAASTGVHDGLFVKAMALSDGKDTVVIVGSDAEDGGLEPWSLIEGTWDDIKAPEAVAVDRTYLNELGIKGVGDTAQIATGRVRVRAITDNIRSFTQSPYTYTTLNRARALFGDSDGTTFYLVQLEPGADVEKVRQDLQKRLEGAEVLTKQEFRDRSLKQWLFRTGAGVALIGGALLGSLVGTVIVAQPLYSSTKDHLSEFATLRALGSSSGYIHQVILAQAGISAVIGYLLGISIALTILVLSKNTALPMVMTPGLAFWLFTLTVGMCAISALSAIVKVTKIDPATVFNR